MSLESTIQKGCTPPDNIVRCKDGFTMSVIAGSYCYSEPRGVGPFTHVEVGYPNFVPQPWSAWVLYAEKRDNPTGTVYGFVPVDMVRYLVELHGGEL